MSSGYCVQFNSTHTLSWDSNTSPQKKFFIHNGTKPQFKQDSYSFIKVCHLNASKHMNLC